MYCSQCHEAQSTLYASDNDAMLCEICHQGARKCIQCKGIFTYPKKDGSVAWTLSPAGWYCWDCLITKAQSLRNADDEEEWFSEVPVNPIKFKSVKEEKPIQVCTVIFEEIQEDKDEL